MSTTCDTPPAIGCYGTLFRLQQGYKADDYEGHDCVPSLTPEGVKQAEGLLKSAISTSPEKGIVNFLQEEQLSECH